MEARRWRRIESMDSGNGVEGWEFKEWSKGENGGSIVIDLYEYDDAM